MSKSKVIYQAAPGAAYNDDDAAIIGRRFEQLSRRHGEPVSPRLFVDDARSKNSPTHEYFEWDDTVAAEEYRVKQAQNLLNHLLRIEVVRGREEKTKAVHNVKVQTDAGESVRGYATLETVRRSPDMRRWVVEQSIRQLVAWRERYGQYKELMKIAESIDEIIEEIRSRKKKGKKRARRKSA